MMVTSYLESLPILACGYAFSDERLLPHHCHSNFTLPCPLPVSVSARPHSKKLVKDQGIRVSFFFFVPARCTTFPSLHPFLYQV
jgi:hypothetical protein